MLAAVNFLKRVGCGHTRSSTGVRNEDGVVVTNAKEKSEVFTSYFDRLYNPHTNTDDELLAE